jgi:hypothetical protein
MIVFLNTVPWLCVDYVLEYCIPWLWAWILPIWPFEIRTECWDLWSGNKTCLSGTHSFRLRNSTIDFWNKISEWKICQSQKIVDCCFQIRKQTGWPNRLNFHIQIVCYMTCQSQRTVWTIRAAKPVSSFLSINLAMSLSSVLVLLPFSLLGRQAGLLQKCYGPGITAVGAYAALTTSSLMPWDIDEESL